MALDECIDARYFYSGLDTSSACWLGVLYIEGNQSGIRIYGIRQVEDQTIYVPLSLQKLNPSLETVLRVIASTSDHHPTAQAQETHNA